MQTQADFMVYAARFPLPEKAVPGHADAAVRLCAGDRIEPGAYFAVDYPYSVDRATPMPARVIAWLLCAVLVCLVVDPPHCDLCDGQLTGIYSSPQTVVNQQQPATPEPCNGICWCCGFHGLPNANPVLSPVNTVASDVWPEPLSTAFAPGSSIYRPPRTDVSS